mgnify:FL=1
MKVNFSPSDFKRAVAQAPGLQVRNRYFEQNPFLTDDGASLLARPGMKKFLSVGQGPIRGIFSEPGAFNGDLFVVSYDSLYRIDKRRNVTLITSGLYSPEQGFVNMAITQNIGTTPEYLFFCDGRNLYVYVENGYATGLLTGTAANNDVVVIGSINYKFTNASVNAGTPAGTGANPWLVNLGANNTEALENLYNAINATGVAGTDYSTALVANTQAKATAKSSTTVAVRATAVGALGNSVATTETGAALSWGGATMSGGGTASVTTVTVPDDVAVIDVAVSKSFVVVIPAQGYGINGQFYWIEPGETTIDPLNFATAESAPDAIFSVKVIGDQFWLPGESTVEIWYFTGDALTPVRRLAGVVFDRGTWEATAVAIDNTLIVCDADGAVFSITGGQPERISKPDIEEQIRKSIQNQQAQTP